MTRQDYIAGLEEIREQVKNIGKAFAAVDLTDATGMESERRKKTTKIVADLCDRLYEDIAISAKVAADNAEAGIGEQGDLFDDAAKGGAEVVDVVVADETKPLALPAPTTEETAEDPKPAKKGGKKSGKGGKSKSKGKKGGAK